MKHSFSHRLIASGMAISLITLLAGMTSAQTAPPITPIDPSQTLNPAMSTPDQFSWQIFAAINAPANNDSNEVQWETWATDGDTFPSEPQPATCKAAKPEAKHCPLWPQDKFRPEARVASVQQSLGHITTSSKASDLQSTGFITYEELVYRNRAAFDYIVDTNLWYLEGIQAAVSKTLDIQFPIAAIEVKSDWQPFPEGCDNDRYHCAVDQKGAEWGLVGMHIMTKQTPAWTWATFEHVDNPGRCDYIGCRDSFGQAPAKVLPNSVQNGLVYQAETLTPALLEVFEQNELSEHFQNYRLKGSQTNYTDPVGRPLLLGNSIAENGFMTTASCMTCHAKAAFNKQGQSLNFLTPVTSPTSPTVSIPGVQLIASFGTPDPAWFYDSSGNASYVQMDFVWAMLNAKPIKK